MRSWLCLAVLALLALRGWDHEIQFVSPLSGRTLRGPHKLALAAGSADAVDLGDPSAEKHIVVVSDSTGVTAARLVDRLLWQFEASTRPQATVVPKVSTVERLSEVVRQARELGPDVLLVGTFVNAEITGWCKSLCQDTGVRFLDVMTPLLDEFASFFEESAIGLPGLPSVRRVKNMVNDEFFSMVEAVKFGQRHFAGLNPQDWGDADLVLLGPSRVGKGPVGHYLAQRGVKVATVNTSPDDPLLSELDYLDPAKVAILVLEPLRLRKLREARVVEAHARNMALLLEPGYATEEQVRRELDFAYELHRLHPEWEEPIDITSYSIEECTSRLFRKIRAARSG